MAVPWQVMNRMRDKIKRTLRLGDTLTAENQRERDNLGQNPKTDDLLLDQRFYTYDYDSQQIVTNYKISGYHFIFDIQGNLIKQHKD